jgi:hypothetical protein
MTRRLGVAFAVVLSLTASAFAERPHSLEFPRPYQPELEAVSSNVIFLDRCANGCTLYLGQDNSTTDHSSLVKGTSTLTAFNCGDQVWQQVVSCMQDVFSSYNVVITDVDPGTQSHLEVKVAGNACDVLPASYCASVGGVAFYTCASYVQNALVFDFANEWSCNVNEICATAAQEIAHTWSLDHVTNNADPMTYFAYGMRRYFADGDQCGSDCSNASGYCKVGQSGCTAPDGVTACSTQQVHTCRCTSSTTQNDNQAILNIFGAGNPVLPTVTITKPLDGEAVSPGFAVAADVSSPYGVMKADLTVDGMPSGSITSSPYVFNAPATLAPGAHNVVVTGYDIHSNKTTAMITAIIGNPCTKASDCPGNSDYCIGGRCVPGSGVPGGLGSMCATSTDCKDNLCASDGTNMYCTVACQKGQCPSGFGCLPTGMGSDTSGVCWPSYDDGSGGCNADRGAPVTLGLVCLGLALSRRRRRA